MSIPARYYVSPNRPNPFNPETEIEFGLPVPSSVTLRIYNVAGLLVRTVIDKEMPAGVHVARWNARDSEGSAVSSGVYFYELRAGSFEGLVALGRWYAILGPQDRPRCGHAPRSRAWPRSWLLRTVRASRLNLVRRSTRTVKRPGSNRALHHNPLLP